MNEWANVDSTGTAVPVSVVRCRPAAGSAPSSPSAATARPLRCDEHLGHSHRDLRARPGRLLQRSRLGQRAALRPRISVGRRGRQEACHQGCDSEHGQLFGFVRLLHLQRCRLHRDAERHVRHHDFVVEPGARFDSQPRRAAIAVAAARRRPNSLTPHLHDQHPCSRRPMPHHRDVDREAGDELAVVALAAGNHLRKCLQQQQPLQRLVRHRAARRRWRRRSTRVRSGRRTSSTWAPRSERRPVQVPSATARPVTRSRSARATASLSTCSWPAPITTSQQRPAGSASHRRRQPQRHDRLQQDRQPPQPAGERLRSALSDQYQLGP